MRLEALPLAGAFVIRPELREDERGFFARVFCVDELREHGLDMGVCQASVSFNHKRGTLRGMHYQAAPHEETKVIRCTAGAVYDVAVDLRPESATYGKWHAVELSAANRLSLYLPAGFAHGFVTLSDHTEVTYLISAPYVSTAGRGLCWNDPGVAISWPITPVVISERDATWPPLERPDPARPR